MLSVTDTQFDEYFGFTGTEVRQMLEYYGLSDHESEMKEWYDEYRFGDEDVYCLWDVINYYSRLVYRILRRCRRIYGIACYKKQWRVKMTCLQS